MPPQGLVRKPDPVLVHQVILEETPVHLSLSPGIVSNRTAAFSFRSIFRSFSRIRSAEYGVSSSHSSTLCLYRSIFVGFGSLNVYSFHLPTPFPGSFLPSWGV